MVRRKLYTQCNAARERAGVNTGDLLLRWGACTRDFSIKRKKVNGMEVRLVALNFVERGLRNINCSVHYRT